MKRLMGHLAQFNSFFNQGEVLCTQSLAYLLQTPEASSVFGEYLSGQIGRAIAPDLTWKAEALQKDGGRCDLEGSAGGRPSVKIEAKLGAPFGEGQLNSYLEDLRSRCGNGGSLLVLVPRQRRDEISEEVGTTFGLAGDGPWSVGTPSCAVGIVVWEDVLTALSAIKSEPFSSDFAQFQAMYRVLKGYDIQPPTSDADVLAWREKEADYINLVDS